MLSPNHPALVQQWNPHLARRIASGLVQGAIYTVPNATGDAARCAADQSDTLRARLAIARHDNPHAPWPIEPLCCSFHYPTHTHTERNA